MSALELGAGFFSLDTTGQTTAVTAVCLGLREVVETEESASVVHGRWAGLGTRVQRVKVAQGEVTSLTWPEHVVWRLTDADGVEWQTFGQTFAAACVSASPVGAVMVTTPVADLSETLVRVAPRFWARDFDWLLAEDLGVLYVNAEDAPGFVLNHPELLEEGNTLASGGFVAVGNGRPPFDLAALETPLDG